MVPNPTPTPTPTPTPAPTPTPNQVTSVAVETLASWSKSNARTLTLPLPLPLPLGCYDLLFFGIVFGLSLFSFCMLFYIQLGSFMDDYYSQARASPCPRP